MLYAAELTWNGTKGVKGDYQNAINRMCRGLPLDTAGDRHGRERTHAGQGPTQPPLG